MIDDIEELYKNLIDDTGTTGFVLSATHYYTHYYIFSYSKVFELTPELYTFIILNKRNKTLDFIPITDIKIFMAMKRTIKFNKI